MGTPEYLSMMRLRKIWAEGSFSVLKREHCISRIRKRGILAATEECLLAAMALNLKRMAKCHLSLSPNLLFCWNHCGFQQIFCFCQQVPYCTLSGRRGYRIAAAAGYQCGRGADKKESTQQPITVGNGNFWLWLKQSRARACRPSGLQSFRHRNRYHATLRNVPQRCILGRPVWTFTPVVTRNS